MKFYIASRWSNMKHVQLLTENLRALGHNVFPLVSDERNFVSGSELNRPALPVEGWQSNQKLREIYEHDLRGIEESDTIILLLPAGKSSHIQAGIGFGLGKNVVLIGQPESAESHYLIFNKVYATIEEYVASLRTL